MVRTSTDAAQFVAPLRTAVLDANRNLAIDIATLNDLIRSSVVDDILTTRVSAFFSIVALALAALGLYGVTSYATRSRTGEFGLRFALGAEPSSVTRMIVREAAVLAGFGLACGLPAALAATGLIRKQLFGVSPLDPWSFGGAVALLVVTTIAAAYVPARRASRVSPLEALRAE
jgi:ABC-type antimicrobial peptide transport system permease subunit